MWTSRQGISLLLLAAAASLTCCTSTEAAPPGGGGSGAGGGTATYMILPFMPDPSSIASEVTDINEQGAVVGTVEFAGDQSQAVHFDVANNVYTTLSGGIRAQGVNNLNQIVGMINDSDAYLGAFWSSPAADPVPLPPLAGDVNSIAHAVNDAGIVVGDSYHGVSLERGVVWRVVVDAGGDVHVDGPVELPPLIAGSWSQARDVNEVVAGESWIVGNADDLAVTWTIALNSDGTLAAASAPVPVGMSGIDWSEGAGINNFADVSGRSHAADSTYFGVPFLALSGENAQPLPVPRDTVYGKAYDLNDDVEIVGSIRVLVRGTKQGPGVEYAWLWKDGNGIDLNKQIPSKSGWNLKWATVISNDGLIGGWGNFDVYFRGNVLIPTGS